MILPFASRRVVQLSKIYSETERREREHARAHQPSRVKSQAHHQDPKPCINPKPYTSITGQACHLHPLLQYRVRRLGSACVCVCLCVCARARVCACVRV